MEQRLEKSKIKVQKQRQELQNLKTENQKLKSSNDEYSDKIQRLEIELASIDTLARADNMMPYARLSEAFSDRRSLVRDMASQRGSNYQKFSSGFSRSNTNYEINELRGIDSEISPHDP